MRASAAVVVLAGFLLPACTTPPEPPPDASLDWLESEVARWSEESGCFSCHNDGDATRVLFVAGRGKSPRLEATRVWLQRPSAWGASGADESFHDRRLATLQFAAAFAAAHEAGARWTEPLVDRVAGLVTSEQDADGRWLIEPADAHGGATTWGTPLATAMAVHVLARLDRAPESRRRGVARLAETTSRRTVDLAAVLLGMSWGGRSDEARARRDVTTRLLEARGSAGAWGPWPGTPPTAFDTALAVLALAAVGEDAAARSGREWLAANRWPEGDWEETTRPSGGVSYSQRVSTTAWATLARRTSELNAP